MDTPDVTKVQAGAGGAFVAILALAIQSGMTGSDLIVVAASSAVVALGAMVSDANVRRGRAGILAAEYRGLQANNAVFGGVSADDEDVDA